MSDTRSKTSTIITVVGFSTLLCAALGAVSAVIPFPVIVGVLFGVFVLTGWLLYLNIDGSKALKTLIALISIVLNVAAMWYSWTLLVSDLATANYLLTGGMEAVYAIWYAAIGGSVSISGIDMGENYLFYSAIAATFAVAFPPLIWGLMSSSTKPDVEKA